MPGEKGEGGEREGEEGERGGREGSGEEKAKKRSVCFDSQAVMDTGLAQVTVTQLN